MTRLRLRAAAPVRLALDGILPEKLAGLSAAEIARLPVGAGNRRSSLGDWFAVETGNGPAERLSIAGGGERLDRIGAGMTAGEIVVEGDAGAYAGLAMRGGRIIVEGSAGFGAAVAMRGGELRIAGSAGDGLGAALPGENAGMRDGLVVVVGAAGAHLGDRMRRGLIVVGGAVGPFCGARLWAGTIIAGGALGPHPGIAMRRGTIVCLGGSCEPPPSFALSGVHELAFARLLARHLVGTPLHHVAPALVRVRRWAGDLAVGGRGEIFVPA